MRKFIVLLFLSACATSTAPTLEQNIYKAEQIDTEVLTLATAALNAHTISSVEEIRVRHVTEAAHNLIVIARSLAKSDPAGAAGRVQAALAMLQPEKTQLGGK